MTKIFMTRHGQTEWNLEHRMQGHKDSSLTKLGEEQAKWLGDRMLDEPIDLIISSPSGRTMQTAELVRNQRDIEICEDESFREINLGEWEGCSYKDIEEKWPVQIKNFWSNPHLYNTVGGETLDDFIHRLGGALENVIANHEGENILIVSHSAAIRAIFTYIEDKSYCDFWGDGMLGSASLSLLEVQGNNREFLYQGDTSHYEESKI